jgi:hypothetical protein
MKTLLLKTLAYAALLLPFSQVQAKTFGSFTPQQKFTLTVTSKESFKQKPAGLPTKAGVPNGVPKFTIGQKVKFKIGANGQLIGQGFSLPFIASLSNGAGLNVYQDPKKAKPSTRKVSFGEVIVIDNVVDAAGLDFTIINVKGANVTTNRVLYGFSK